MGDAELPLIGCLLSCKEDKPLKKRMSNVRIQSPGLGTGPRVEAGNRGCRVGEVISGKWPV